MGILRGLNLDQHLPRGNDLARLDQDSFYHTIHVGSNSLLHFHGFEGNKWIPYLDRLAFRNQDTQHLAGSQESANSPMPGQVLRMWNWCRMPSTPASTRPGSTCRIDAGVDGIRH